MEKSPQDLNSSLWWKGLQRFFFLRKGPQMFLIGGPADICRGKSLLKPCWLFFLLFLFHDFDCLFGDFPIPQNWKMSCCTFGMVKNLWICHISHISQSKTLTRATYRFFRSTTYPQTPNHFKFFTHVRAIGTTNIPPFWILWKTPFSTLLLQRTSVSLQIFWLASIPQLAQSLSKGWENIVPLWSY